MTRRTTDWFENLGAGPLLLQSITADTMCFPVRAHDSSCRLSVRTPSMDLATVRDLVFGPKVLAHLAILRRLARS